MSGRSTYLLVLRTHTQPDENSSSVRARDESRKIGIRLVGNVGIIPELSQKERFNMASDSVVLHSLCQKSHPRQI